MRLATNRVTINTEHEEVDFWKDFFGPACGFISLLFMMQSRLMHFLLTGVRIRCPWCGKKHLGGLANVFNERFRRKIILFSKIYDQDAAHEGEGIKMLKARAVEFPQRKTSLPTLRTRR